jgi:hypothetical protein
MSLLGTECLIPLVVVADRSQKIPPDSAAVGGSAKASKDVGGGAHCESAGEKEASVGEHRQTCASITSKESLEDGVLQFLGDDAGC